MKPRPVAIDWELVLDRLSEFYHTGDWRVPYLRDHAESPFQVLIGTILLSQRTRDANTARRARGNCSSGSRTRSRSRAPEFQRSSG